MTKDECFFFGKMLKPHGKNGEIALKYESSFDEEILEQVELFFIDIDNGLVPFFVSEDVVRFGGEDTILVKFDDIENENQARFLVNRSVWLPNELLSNDTFENEFSQQITGYKIVDQNNTLVGTIIELIKYPNNPVFNVNRNGKETLIPASHELVIQIDNHSKTIQMHIPDGLLDL